MREVPLTKGYVAIVDDEDYEAAMKFKWYASEKGGTVYAERTYWDKEIKCYFGMSLHRYLMGAQPGEKVDHADGNGLLDTRANMRIVTKAQNNWNARKPSHGLSTPYKGVVLFKRDATYRAYIKKDGKQRHLGYFATPEDAARAYNAAALELFGEFARSNLVPNG